MQPAINLWLFAGQFAPRKGHEFWSQSWAVSSVAVGSTCTFSVCSSSVWLFTGLDDVLGRVERMEQGLPGAVPHASQTSDTSGDETDVSEPRRRVRRKKSLKMKKVWGASELVRFFVTGPTDASGKPSHFYCQLCRKDVSVLTHGMHEILRRYQGTKHFPRDQRLRLETPGWRVLDFEGNVMREEEVSRQREPILRGPQVVREREYPFAEDLIVDSSGTVDASLPVLAKVSSLVEALGLGGAMNWCISCGPSLLWLPVK